MDTPNISTKTAKIKDLGANRNDLELEQILKKISSIKSLITPIILFPDLLYKKSTESPASMSTATKGTIVPNLTAPSLGCSMGVIKTNLEEKDLTDDFVKTFYSNIQDNLGQDYSVFRNILVWLGLKKREILKHDLTLEEFENIIKGGAEAAVERYGVPEILSSIENKGSLYSKDEQERLNIKKILPRSSFTNGRHDLGYGFKGNHFLEIQIVEDVFYEETSNLKKGQVVIMYHGGGGMVPYHVGRYYAKRRKGSPQQKLFQFIGKILFHLLSLEALTNFPKRLRYYFFPKEFQEIPINTKEGRRLLSATKASLNYSYAFNVAIYRRVKDALEKIDSAIEIDLVTAKIHNSIMEEEVNGEKLMVHRHTVTRIEPGDLSIVSGFNNTSSYIILGQDGSNEYLNSADHGSGSVIKIMKSRQKEDITTIYRTKEPFRKKVSHITDEGVEYVVKKLEEKNIAKGVVKLKPVASFKG